MGIYIKGMKMPIDCNTCYISDCLLPYSKVVPIGYRHEDCPLVEVAEPHGRLVDVNTAYQDTMIYGEKFRKSVLKIIDDLDTVIESEE